MTLSNSLADLAEQVKVANEAIALAGRTTAEKALEAGRLLIAGKAGCAHGEWLPFLERAGINDRTARRFMTLARSGLNRTQVTDLGGIRGALEHLAGQRREAAEREREAEKQAELVTLEAGYDVLVASNARLADENRRFSEYEVLFAKGGWEAVIAAKDEEIRVLKTRVETESRDKASWKRSERYWKSEAMKRGHSGGAS